MGQRVGRRTLIGRSNFLSQDLGEDPNKNRRSPLYSIARSYSKCTEIRRLRGATLIIGLMHTKMRRSAQVERGALNNS